MKKRKRLTVEQNFFYRGVFLFFIFHLLLLIVLVRLYQHQVIEHQDALLSSNNQYQMTAKISGNRGKIYTADNFLLVGNQNYYRFFLNLNLIKKPQKMVSDVYPFLEKRLDIQLRGIQNQQQLEQKIATFSGNILYLADKVDENLKNQLAMLKIVGLGFDSYQTRIYPEASMASHLLGFVNKEGQGQQGVEGYFDQELKPKIREQVMEIDALKRPLFLNKTLNADNEVQHGRDLVLSIRKDIQTVAEQELYKGIMTTGAKSGEVVVYQVKTGKILALTSWPNYEPANYFNYSASVYKNPALVDLFEPGSVLKVLTISAGIDEGLISPDTTCPQCAGPRRIGQYLIKTWNDQYFPNIDMTTALKKSDNTALVYVGELLGSNRLKKYYRRFGLGQKTNIDLQDDVEIPFPSVWGDIEIANRSFGQGILVNSLQIARLAAAIANDGFLTKPSVVDKIIDSNLQQEYIIAPVIETQAIATNTAKLVQKMMVETFANNEGKWLYQGKKIAGGKSGTAQIPDPNGGYLSGPTLASFVGFLPANNPEVVIYVKLNNPKTSIYAEGTARPIWCKIAEKILIMM